jgi:hypothetical protein
MKYPKAGDLQRKLGVELTDNPCGCDHGDVKRNPFEVRSASGLEGVFADEDNAEFYAQEIRESGAVDVTVGRRDKATRPRPPKHALQQQNPGPRVLREKWGDSTEIVVERHRYGISGWLESKRGGGRHPISFGDKKPETLREAMEEAKKFLNRVYGKSNPAGLTAKGERMYEHVKKGYGADPRAEEIAARTVLARAKEVPGLYRNPPFVLPVPGQRIKSWDHGDGKLVRICEEGTDGSYTARIQLDDGRRVTVPLMRTEYDLTPRKVLERRTGFSRHEEFIGAPAPERFPRGTPMEFDDTAPVAKVSGPMVYDEAIQGWVPARRHQLPGRRR